MLPIIISIVSLLVAICNTFYYTRISNRLSVRTRLTDLMDKVYDISYERVCLLSNKEEGKYTKIAEKQLRMKHLLFEIDEIAQTEPLSQPQNRLLAESFESLLYYDYAQKYWDRVFEVSFVTPELEAEYQRRYGQFLYAIGDFSKGQAAFEKSLALPNDSENRKYINLQTYTDWAEVEFKREEKKYYLDKYNKKDTPFPALERTYTILQKASLLLKQFKDYSFYSSAIDYYNHVISSITAFKEKETNRFFYFTMNATTDKREYIRIDSYL